MTWAIFAQGSHCKLPLELTASHIPPDHGPPSLTLGTNKTGRLSETTSLQCSSGDTETVTNQAPWLGRDPGCLVPAQVSLHCPSTVCSVP